MPKKSNNETCPKGKDPGTCTPAEIKECHGATRQHPCEGTNKK